MADLNHVVLVGRLTRDAELKYTANGQAVCKFSAAVGRRRKQGEGWVEETSFFDITLWGKSGETLNQYLVKGKQVGIDGELRQERWEQDGQNRSKVTIVANNVQLLGGGQDGRNGAQTGGDRESHQNRQRVDSRGVSGSANASKNPASCYDIPEAPPDDGFTDDIPF